MGGGGGAGGDLTLLHHSAGEDKQKRGGDKQRGNLGNTDKQCGGNGRHCACLWVCVDVCGRID